jgi:hypothetical protein
MVESLSKLPGYAEDVARWLVSQAKYAADGIASVDYEGLPMEARSDSNPRDLAWQHERRLYDRKYGRPRLYDGNEVPPPSLLSLFERRRLSPPRNDWLGSPA